MAEEEEKLSKKRTVMQIGCSQVNFLVFGLNYFLAIAAQSYFAFHSNGRVFNHPKLR